MALPFTRSPSRTRPGRGVLLLSLLLGVACAPALRAPPAPSPEEIARLEADLAADPEATGSLVALAVAYRNAGRPADARPLLERALAAAPTDPGATVQLGLTYEDLELFPEARTLYERYLEAGTSRALRSRLENRIALLERRVLRAAIREALASEAALGGVETSPSYVAVFPFAYQGTNPDLAPLSRALAELLATDLAQTDRITVLERTQMQILLDELRLSGSGVVDPATAARGGHLLGAGRIVQGQVNDADDLIRLQAAVVDVADAQVGDPFVEQDALRQLFELEKRLALSIYRSLGVELTAAERERVNQRPTENLQALLQYGLALQAEDRGDYAAAAQYFQSAAQLDPTFESAEGRARETQQIAATESVTPAELGALATAELAQAIPALEAVEVLIPTSISGRDAVAEVIGTEGVGRQVILEVILRRPQ